MQQRHHNRQQYFQELAHTAEAYVIPFIESVHPVTAGSRILEIGCGEGGNLEPFVKRGCQVTGIDLSPVRIEQAKEYLHAAENSQVELIAADIFSVQHLDHAFDIILIHDVIEHILDKRGLFTAIRKFLKPEGIAFIGFPAWQMPFGGHQQTCKSKWTSHMPFIHLLPNVFYKMVLRSGGESHETIDGLLSIKECRINIEQFRRYARETHFSIEKELFYFINPHYQIKFGLRPRVLSPVVRPLPWIRNFFTTSCFYLVKPQTT